MTHESAPSHPPRPRLGELLLRRGACDLEALRRAWELKVIYGDRLGTNLLAEGLVEEQALALALGEQHGVHAAYGELLRVDPRAARLLSAPFADRHDVVPHHVQEGVLYLLMVDPHDVEVLDLVAKGTGLRVAPVVVCEARMWALLLEHYGISRGMRPIALDGDPFLQAKRRLAAAEERKKEIALGPELTSEEEFHALYMGRAFGAMPDTGAAENPETPPSSSKAEPPLVEPAVAQGTLLEDVTPIVAGRAISSPDETPVATVRPLEVTDAAALEPLPLIEPIALPVIEPVGPAVVEEPELTPLSFDEATAHLTGVSDRDEIARVVLRYALTRFRRAALLTVHSHGVFGWEGLGDLPRDAVRRFRLPRSERSLFSVVVENQAHYIGPLQTFTANGAWVKALGRKLPRSVAVFPIFVRGRVVNLLYGDNGHGEHVESDVGELLILAQRIADSYEALLREPLAISH